MILIKDTPTNSSVHRAPFGTVPGGQITPEVESCIDVFIRGGQMTGDFAGAQKRGIWTRKQSRYHKYSLTWGENVREFSNSEPKRRYCRKPEILTVLSFWEWILSGPIVQKGEKKWLTQIWFEQNQLGGNPFRNVVPNRAYCFGWLMDKMGKIQPSLICHILEAPKSIGWWYKYCRKWNSFKVIHTSRNLGSTEDSWPPSRETIRLQSQRMWWSADATK